MICGRRTGETERVRHAGQTAAPAFRGSFDRWTYIDGRSEGGNSITLENDLLFPVAGAPVELFLPAILAWTHARPDPTWDR